MQLSLHKEAVTFHFSQYAFKSHIGALDKMTHLSIFIISLFMRVKEECYVHMSMNRLAIRVPEDENTNVNMSNETTLYRPMLHKKRFSLCCNGAPQSVLMINDIRSFYHNFKLWQHCNKTHNDNGFHGWQNIISKCVLQKRYRSRETVRTIMSHIETLLTWNTL